MKQKQGASVMCDRTYGSNPAHPQFWLDCLPNEEHRKTQKIKSFKKKLVYERKESLQSK